jgi:hypothetical protein
MEWECVVFKNGHFVEPLPNRWLWNGGFSIAHARGKIIQYIKECLEPIEKKNVFVIPCTDGNLKKKHLQEYIDRYPEYTVILGTLGQSFEEDGINYIYLPLDDGFFEHGIMHFFPEEQRVPWEKRISKVYWRGGCSGEGVLESARVRTVANLIDFPHADVKLNWWWADGKNIPSHYFAGRESHLEFMKYKMILIIDGNVIASSHMWTFATGAVPLLVSNATCWFSRFLRPFENYIPIKYDLSDLHEKINWVMEHDSQAEIIAKNALEFATTIFSANFQRVYIKNEIISKL